MTEQAPPEFPYSKQLAEVQAAAAAEQSAPAEPVVVIQTNDEVIVAAIDEAVRVIKLQATNRGQAMKMQVQGVGEAVVELGTMRPVVEAAARSAMLAEQSANNSHLTMSELRADMASLSEMFDATLSRRQRRRLKRYSDRMAKETE